MHTPHALGGGGIVLASTFLCLRGIVQPRGVCSSCTTWLMVACWLAWQVGGLVQGAAGRLLHGITCHFVVGTRRDGLPPACRSGCMSGRRDLVFSRQGVACLVGHVFDGCIASKGFWKAVRPCCTCIPGHTIVTLGCRQLGGKLSPVVKAFRSRCLKPCWRSVLPLQHECTIAAD